MVKPELLAETLALLEDRLDARIGNRLDAIESALLHELADMEKRLRTEMQGLARAQVNLTLAMHRTDD